VWHRLRMLLCTTMRQAQKPHPKSNPKRILETSVRQVSVSRSCRQETRHVHSTENRVICYTERWSACSAGMRLSVQPMTTQARHASDTMSVAQERTRKSHDGSDSCIKLHHDCVQLAWMAARRTQECGQGYMADLYAQDKVSSLFVRRKSEATDSERLINVHKCT
jgi:hypothetical protein